MLAELGLTKMPFDKNLKANELFDSYDSKESKARFEHIKRYKGILLITGEPGAGKTTALRRFTSTLNPQTYEHCYTPHATVSRTELYRQLNTLFKLPVKMSKTVLFNQIQRNIWDLYKGQGKIPCIILDECHLMDDHTLQELVLLTNFEMDSQMPLILILSGLPDLAEKLKRRRHEPLNQRITLRYQMEGMKSEDTKAYIQHHLKVAGRSDPLFDESGYEVVHQLAMGLPRKVGNLCQGAMTLAALKGEKLITGDLVHKAAGGL